MTGAGQANGRTGIEKIAGGRDAGVGMLGTESLALNGTYPAMVFW